MAFPRGARLEHSNTTIPTILRYTFGIQRSLPGAWRVRATYVGARGNHLYRGYEANLYPHPIIRADGTLFFPDDCDDPVYQDPTSGLKPSAFCRPGASKGLNPAFSSGIRLTNSDAQSFYNALQLSANKSLSGGLSLQASYTFSKSVDDASFHASGRTATNQYPYQRTLARSLSDFDIRHRLVVNYFYNLPFGSGRSWATSGILSKMFGGWRLGGIFRARTGTPFTATVSVRNPGYLFAATQPNLIAGQSNNPTSGVSVGCSAVEAGRELQAPRTVFRPLCFPGSGAWNDRDSRSQHADRAYDHQPGPFPPTGVPSGCPKTPTVSGRIFQSSQPHELRETVLRRLLQVFFQAALIPQPEEFLLQTQPPGRFNWSCDSRSRNGQLLPHLYRCFRNRLLVRSAKPYNVQYVAGRNGLSSSEV